MNTYRKVDYVKIVFIIDSSSEQLTLQKGQLLVVRKKADSGWWEGELQAKGRNKQIGWFPATYVKVSVI